METQPLDDNSWESKFSRRLERIAEKVNETHEMQKTLILAINSLNQRLTQIEIQLSEQNDTEKLDK